MSKKKKLEDIGKDYDNFLERKVGDNEVPDLLLDDENLYKNLTTKQYLFCQEYVKDFNITKACLRAGYSESYGDKHGYFLLQNEHIKKQINKIYFYKRQAEQDNIETIKANLYRLLLQAEKQDDMGTQLKVLDMLAKMNNAYVTTNININQEDKPLFPDVEIEDIGDIEDIDYDENDDDE